MSYRVFVRNWWKWEKGMLVPDPRARKHTIQRGIREESEAQRIAQEYNRTHKPGPLSRKAEYLWE